MADKMTCPACDSHLSRVLEAFNMGEPCPVCGLPQEAAVAVFEAQKRGVSDELQKRYLEAEHRATKAETETRMLRNRLAQIRQLMDQPDSDFGPLDI